jgi:MFS family permease
MSRPGLWGHADFLRLWTAQAISAFGSRITRTALPIIAVATLHQPDTIIGLLTALQLAPGMVLGLFAGGFVDRGRKRRIMIGADLVRAAAVASITLAWWAGALTMVHVIVVGAIVGGSSALFAITDVAYLPALIGRNQLADGNAKLETTEAIAEITGPASAGALIGLLGAPLTVAIDAASYVWSAMWLGTIRTPDPVVEQPAARPSLRADLATGLRTVFGNRYTGPIEIAHTVWSISGGFFMATYVVFLLRTLGLSEATFGVIVAMGGIGSLAGAVVSRVFVRWVGLGPTLLVTSTMSVAGALLIPLAEGRPHMLAFLVAHQFISDGFSVAFVIQAVTLRQTVLPKATLGRVNAAVHVASGSMLAVGALAGGVIGQLAGTRVAVWVGVLIGLLVPVLLLPLAKLRAMPADADASGVR